MVQWLAHRGESRQRETSSEADAATAALQA